MRAVLRFLRTEAVGLMVASDGKDPGLRRRNPRNPLTQRFHVVCYLAEVRPDNYGRFVNERRHFTTGSLILAGHLLRSACKHVKGRCLLRWHDIR